MSHGLTSDLIEQAQVVAELIESGEFIPKQQTMVEIPINDKIQVVKRNASAMAQADSSKEAEINHFEHKAKRKKISTVKNSLTHHMGRLKGLFYFRSILCK